MNMTTLDAIKRTHEIISIDEYLRRREHDPSSVDEAQMIAPKLGSSGFGKFRVRLESPIYAVIDTAVCE